MSLLMVSCGSRKAKKNADENLPKDVALMPDRDYTKKGSGDIEKDRESIRLLREEIFTMLENVRCTNPDDWRISPLGSKACGGPASFIAYPIEIETVVLPKITEFNKASSNFNLKYGIISDCAVTPAPSDVQCENGKAVLVYDSTI